MAEVKPNAKSSKKKSRQKYDLCLNLENVGNSGQFRGLESIRK